MPDSKDEHRKDVMQIGRSLDCFRPGSLGLYLVEQRSGGESVNTVH